MARVGLQIPTRKVVDGFVKVAPLVDVEVRKVSDDTLATLYTARSGGTTITQPVTSDANGELEVIVDEGSYYAAAPAGAPADELFAPQLFDTSTGPTGPQGPIGLTGSTGSQGPAGDPSAIELGHAQITADFTRTGVGTSDVTGLSITVTVGARPIELELGAQYWTTSAGAGFAVASIQEGATVLADARHILTNANNWIPLSRKVRLAPSAGSHTYKVTLAVVVSGNATIGATANSPAFLRAIQV